MQTGTDSGKPFTLGVLFVHGIGSQMRGETLASFGGPLCKWLEYRCLALAQSQQIPTEAAARSQRKLETADWAHEVLPKTVDRESADGWHLHRVVLRETTFHDQVDSEAPAHTKIALLTVDADEQVSAENWLLAESCWADRFASPSFADLARWGFGVMPWIVGSHFAAQVERRLHERPAVSSESASGPRTRANHHVWAITLWTWRLMAAVGGFGLGLLSTLITIPLLALFLIVGLVPIPKLRSALLNIQLRLASTIGDCFVLLARPIEAASIVSGVRRDLRWLASKCSEVVIVAHSQGGAVAHLALRGSIPGELKLLFTFGSGLRKLEEARELMRSEASFGLSAVATSIALSLLLLCTSLVLLAIVDNQQQSASSIIWIVVIGVGASAVLVAGVRDHLKGIRLPELDRWIEWLDAKKLRWRDCYASGDPVPNGIVTAAAKDRTLEVCNLSSMVSDHTSYWSNLDEFVSALYEEIGLSREKDPVPDLRVATPLFQRVARRRRWRVALGRCMEWTAAIGVAAVLVHQWKSCKNFLMWAWARTGAPIVESVLGIELRKSPGYSIDWTTVGLLALMLGAFAIVRSLWNAWDQNDMKRSIGLRSKGDEFVVFTALWFLLIITAHVVSNTTDLSFVLFALSFLPIFVFIVLQPNVVDRRRTKPSAAASAETSVGTLASTAIGLGMAAALPYSLGLAGWDALLWFIRRVAPARVILLGVRLEDIPSEAVGGAVVLVSAAAWILVSLRRKAASASPAALGH